VDRHPNCIAWQQRAETVLAGGPGTFSKHWTRYPQGVAPFSVVAGEGCYVAGTDGHMYLDTVAALGAVFLGYNDPSVTLAIIEQAKRGCSFSMVHPLEIEVAEILCDRLPCAEMVRFMRNGTDATATAVRLARAITGRRHVIFAGYHGGAMDSYGITTDKIAGILPGMAYYNHQETWQSWKEVSPHVWEDLACIMTEVPALPWGTPASAYHAVLADMQEEAHAHGALMVLDEVVTFPRSSQHGCQGVYGVTPDVSCVSKGIANGMPLAAVVGKREYMSRLDQGDVFASWTFAGEATALAACKATLEAIAKPYAVDAMHNYGRQYGNALHDLTSSIGATVYGHPWRIVVRWHDMPGASANALRTLWLQEHAKESILHGIGAIFPMVCWNDDDLERLVDVASDVAGKIQVALEQGKVRALLECPVIGDVLSVR
jgi:glutamate-1-semialdehyde 2,1-aminomutase